MKGEAGITYQSYIYNIHKSNCWTQATYHRVLPISHIKTLHYLYFIHTIEKHNETKMHLTIHIQIIDYRMQ